jgi:hypothetical protein
MVIEEDIIIAQFDLARTLPRMFSFMAKAPVRIHLQHINCATAFARAASK